MLITCIRNSNENTANDILVEPEDSTIDLYEPPQYQVILLNDDYTPMDFVVEILEHFFSLNKESAISVMLTVHQKGKAVCGVFTHDVAESKAEQVNQYARAQEHPLLCSIKPNS